MYGILSPLGVILLLLFYLSVTIFSLIKMFGREEKIMLFVWLFVIVFFPFVGSLVYLLYYYSNRTKPAFIN